MTVPSHGQRRWIDPTYGADSLMVECSGPDTVHVDSIRLYQWQDGQFRYFKGYYVRGQEGQPFSTDSLPPGQYIVKPMNGAGEGCASNVASVPFPTPTAVPVVANPVPKFRVFNVRGQLVPEGAKKARGRYYRKPAKGAKIQNRAP